MESKNHNTTNPSSKKLCGDCQELGYCKMYDLNKHLISEGNYNYLDNDNPVELFKAYNKRVKELMNYMPSLFFTFQEMLADGARKTAYQRGQDAYAKQDYATAKSYFTSPDVEDEDDFGTVAQFCAAMCNYYLGNYREAISLMTLFDNNVMWEFSRVATEFIHICNKIIEENEAASPVLQKYVERIVQAEESSQKVEVRNSISLSH